MENFTSVLALESRTISYEINSEKEAILVSGEHSLFPVGGGGGGAKPPKFSAKPSNF